MKQLTVKQIVDMIDNKELSVEQSTQRKFVYANIDIDYPSVTPGDNFKFRTTKAGALLYSILYEKIHLPAIYIWHNTDTNENHLLDGKQRILTLYYFINNDSTTFDIYVPTGDSNGKAYCDLTNEEQQYILNYTFDVCEYSGNSAEEECTFYRINTNALPLTQFESIAGCYYGNFITDFCNEIDRNSPYVTGLEPINRGEQAYSILAIMSNAYDEHGYQPSEIMFKTISNYIRQNRHLRFKIKDGTPLEKGQIEYDLMPLLKTAGTLSAKVKLDYKISLLLTAIAIKDGIQLGAFTSYYESACRKKNDIKKWKIDTHLLFSRSKFKNGGLELDPLRFFTDDVKNNLYETCPCCSYPGCTESKYGKLTVDHKTAWSKGGKTDITNAQLLCNYHNGGKGNK